MADDTFTQADIDKAIKAAIDANNADRDTSEAGLKKKVDELLAEKKTEAEKARAAQEEAVRIAEEAARKSGDVEALEKSWSDKFNKAAEESKEALASATSVINKLTAGSAAKDIAASLAVKGSEGILEQLITPRLGVDMRDGGAIVTILDEHGKPSALSVDEFKESLTSNAAMAPLLAGTKGNGGGATSQNGRAEDSTATVNLSQWNTMDTAARSKHSNAGGKVVPD